MEPAVALYVIAALLLILVLANDVARAILVGFIALSLVLALAGGLLWVGGTLIVQDNNAKTLARETEQLSETRKLQQMAQRQALQQDEWRKKAEEGDAEAQYNLGLIYKIGLGITRNYETAYFWLFRAASQGHKKSQEAITSIESQLTSEQVSRIQKAATGR